MWGSSYTRRKESGTEEYPTAKNLIENLLQTLIERGCIDSWMHVELVADGGWFYNLLRGKHPWVEVAYNKHFLQLNVGLSNSILHLKPNFKKDWDAKGSRNCNVPFSDSEPLAAWIEQCLRSCVPPAKSFVVSGWIEG